MVILLVVAQLIIGYFVRDNYYNSATNIVLNRLSSINATLTSSNNMQEDERYQLLLSMTENFTEKEKFALMLIGEEGNIISTSTGFLPNDSIHVDDINQAANSDESLYVNNYQSDLNENVLAVTQLIYPTVGDVYAVRMVTSLKNVDSEISIILAFVFLASVAIIIFYIISGLYFVRSIVNPMQAIEKTAKEIAKGDFDVRIEHNYNNEMGSLCDTINDMAQDLAKSDEIKNEFISNISHELRTPLTAIKGWAETIDNKTDEKIFNKGKNIILSETERLYSMVETLLDFSRLQQAEIVLNKEKLDLVAEVSDAVLMFSPKCEELNIKINFDDSMDIVPIYADKNRIKQVLINIIDNALKYSKQDSEIDVNIDYKKQERKAILSIKDYGRGIHPDDLKKVTQKFFKGKGAKRGSGIGLSLVNEIIQAHLGELDIQSEYKHSTTVTITLNTLKTLRGR